MAILHLALLVSPLAKQRSAGGRGGLGWRTHKAMGLCRVRHHGQMDGAGTGISYPGPGDGGLGPSIGNALEAHGLARILQGERIGILRKDGQSTNHKRAGFLFACRNFRLQNAQSDGQRDVLEASDHFVAGRDNAWPGSANCLQPNHIGRLLLLASDCCLPGIGPKSLLGL